MAGKAMVVDTRRNAMNDSAINRFFSRFHGIASGRQRPLNVAQLERVNEGHHLPSYAFRHDASL